MTPTKPSSTSLALPMKCPDPRKLEGICRPQTGCRVLRSWTEDFVDEDTGEVVTIERNEIILERDTYFDEDNIELILECRY
jgi:DNA-directed RNA polymerase subunit beta